MSEQKNTPDNVAAGRGNGEAGDNPGNAAAEAVLADVETMRAKARERDEFLGLLQRTQAEFENYQKRNQREREQERKYGHRGFALDLLPVIDNLERATVAAQQAGETGPLVQGVVMVQDQLLTMLKRHGITPIDAQGQIFDPNLHQAVMKQQATDQSPNTVVQVLERGFMMHDRVLRPARVIVAVAPENA